MKRTFKIKLDLEKDEREKLLDLMSHCAEMYNAHIDWAFENRSWSKKRAHNDLYHILREEHPTVPSPFVQTVRDIALENVKALKFKFRPKRVSRSTLRYDKRCFKLRGRQLTLSFLGDRIRKIINVPEWCEERFDASTVKFLNIKIDRKNRFFAHFVCDLPDPIPKQEGETIGIDRGVKSLITTSRGESLGNELKRVRRKHHHLRRKLQAKGTRSARRLLKTLSGKEQRFSRETNHIVSKQLAEDENVKTYVIENLTGIRKGARRGKKRKKANRWINSWPFFQFEQFLTYKSIGNEIEVVRVSPKYTSQDCSECGFRDPRNRDGSDFKCLRCGHHENADVNAAKNIRNRHITSLLENISGDAGHSQLSVRMGE